jgi:CsoR family transcriptional regulator, copper-sensing transcriptional repressor
MGKVIAVHQPLKVEAPREHVIASKRTKKAILAREAKAIGHLQSVMAMSQKETPSAAILIQLRAVEKEIVALEKALIRERATSSLAQAMKTKDPLAADEVLLSIDEAMKTN